MNKMEGKLSINQELDDAENELRKKAKELYRDIENTYWELGKALYEVYDGLPGGYRSSIKGDGAAEVRRELFIKWGYNSFEEYCEKEIGILRRSASSLRRAYWWFEIELKLPTELRTQVKMLGRSKIYLLSGFANNDNIVSWLEKANAMTYEELKKAVTIAKASNRGLSEDDDDMFEYAKSGATSVNDPSEPPPPEHARTLTTSLYDGQWDTWEAALDRAKNITGSDKISHNLEMICTDYLSTNDFMAPSDDQKRYLAKVEKLTGLKLIAIDPQSGKPVFGADLLWGMVKQRVEFEQSDQVNRDQANVVESDKEPPAAF